jgi:MFS family permease
MDAVTLEPTRPSAFAPLRTRIFLAIWIAAMTSNIGSLIQSVGEKWQMTQLTPSTFLVALIETGTTLPILLLGLAAGAIADIVDRRRWLITTQVFMMGVAGVLSVLTFLHMITPGILFAMAMLIGIGSSLSMPAFQAIVPEILPKQDLSGGVALNSAGYNISRAIGPALGGLIVGWLGAGWAFLLNAISFLAVVVVMWRWKRQVPAHDLPSERFLGAMKVGFRYVRHSRPLQIILVRTTGYIWFSGVIFSLLPALAIHRLGLGSTGFGLLTSCVGAGAVFITFVLPQLRIRFSANQLLAGFTIVAVLAQLVIALEPHILIIALCLFLAGTSWLAIFSTINTAIQLSVPSWVKARAFGAYQMAWGGAMALAAAFWGAVAERLGLPAGFALSALGMLIVLFFIGRLHIAVFEEEEQDLAPHTDTPHSETSIPLDAGPILVQLEFSIPERHKESFLEAMQQVRRLRLRDGAMRWALFEDPERTSEGHLKYMECYLSSSMGEHLRQHHRNTNADRQVLARAFRLDPSGRPVARHLVTADEEEPSLFQRFWQ